MFSRLFSKKKETPVKKDCTKQWEALYKCTGFPMLVGQPDKQKCKNEFEDYTQCKNITPLTK